MGHHVVSCEGERQAREYCVINRVHDSAHGRLIEVHLQLIANVRLVSRLKAVQ